MKVLTVDYRNPEAPAQFAESLKRTGFAVIRNHPLPQDLIASVFADWKNYFESGDKMADKFDAKTQAGYFPFKSENAKDSKVKDLKEFFHLFTETPLPASVPVRTKELYGKMTDFAIELLGWVQNNTPDAIRNEFSIPLTEMIQGSRETLLRPIHYPPLTGAEEEGAIRAAAH
ncbi:MAG: isopenicillin N synthase family oxygenase, partial [Proteobacteria bacterium]